MMQPPQSSPPPQQDNQREKSAVPVPVFVGVVLIVALIIVCGLGALGVIPSLHGLKNPTAPSTAIPTQSAAHAATLGGTLGDFVQRYGSSIDESGLMYAATLAGQRVLIVVALDDPLQSRDGRSRVVALDVQVPGDALGAETWSAATADTIAQGFLPLDAQFQRAVTTHGITYRIYHSDEMAATFIPGAYTNVSGALSYSCHAWPPTPMAAGSGSGYGQCHIAIGGE
jgi:hypothetical protein